MSIKRLLSGIFPSSSAASNDARPEEPHGHLFGIQHTQVGRLYVRDVDSYTVSDTSVSAPKSGSRIVFGVIELPNNVLEEKCYGARLNADGFAINFNFAMDLAVPSQIPADAPPPQTPLSDFSISEVLKFFAFRAPSIQDGVEMFIRKTPLPNNDPSKAWYFIAGSAREGFITSLSPGLYDLGAGDRLFKQQIETADYAQLPPTEVFAEPLWGHEGNLGFSSDFKIGRHDIAEDRRRAAISAGDPAFKLFCESLDKECPPLAYYTVDEYADRKTKLGEIAARVNYKVQPQNSSSMPDLKGLTAAAKAAQGVKSKRSGRRP